MISRTIKRYRDAISRYLKNPSTNGEQKKSPRNKKVSVADRRSIIRKIGRGQYMTSQMNLPFSQRRVLHIYILADADFSVQEDEKPAPFIEAHKKTSSQVGSGEA